METAELRPTRTPGRRAAQNEHFRMHTFLCFETKAAQKKDDLSFFFPVSSLRGFPALDTAQSARLPHGRRFLFTCLFTHLL